MGFTDVCNTPHGEIELGAPQSVRWAREVVPEHVKFARPDSSHARHERVAHTLGNIDRRLKLKSRPGGGADRGRTQCGRSKTRKAAPERPDWRRIPSSPQPVSQHEGDPIGDRLFGNTQLLPDLDQIGVVQLISVGLEYLHVAAGLAVVLLRDTPEGVTRNDLVYPLATGLSRDGLH